MAKRQSGAILTRLQLNHDSVVPLSRQLEEQLRSAILSNLLPGGTRLPSSRSLAIELGISRPTIMVVLERLKMDGFLKMHRGAGTFVTDTVPLHLPQRPKRLSKAAIFPAPPNISALGARFLTLDADIDARDTQPFLPNTPAYDQFPFALWQKCVSRQLQKAGRKHMGYGDPAGFEPLRRAIANYLALHRSDDCDPDQIVITPGGHAAFMIAAQLLTNPGDGLLFEDPGPLIARNLFESLDRKLIYAPVDDEGMNFEAITSTECGLRLAFTMPSRHHPLGCSLSERRRVRLLEWARSRNGWILEDDYDSEFRYTGRPLSSIRSRDDSGRVIYVGTFSKALFPALRVGYFVLPFALVGMFRNAMALMFRSVPLATQMALAEFLDEGYFAAHLRAMRELYSERRVHFLDAARQAGAGLYQVDEPNCGMNAMIWLPEGLDDRIVAQRAVASGIHCYPLSDYCVRHFPRPGLIVGFTSVAQHQFMPGLQTLANIVAQERPTSSPSTRLQ